MKFGIREICDVVLRAKTAQKIGNKIFFKNEPVCYFDTLKTSTFEGAATTVYAQGGRGNARLMSWDGERTVTFTMEDALISPVGLSILTGAGLVDASENEPIIVHMTEQVSLDFSDSSKLINDMPTITLSNIPYWKADESTIYVLGLDDNGDPITEPYLFEPFTQDSRIIVFDYKNNYGPPEHLEEGQVALRNCSAAIVDYYVKKTSNTMAVEITPDKFGGSFYLEASTLWRDQATGQDLPAEFIIPNCRIQSNFSFSMSSSGDPSTFTFTVDAFPDYTRWDRTKKVLATIQVVDVNQSGLQEALRKTTYANQSDYELNIKTSSINASQFNTDLTPKSVTFKIGTKNANEDSAVSAFYDSTTDKVKITLYIKENDRAPENIQYIIAHVSTSGAIENYTIDKSMSSIYDTDTKTFKYEMSLPRATAGNLMVDSYLESTDEFGERKTFNFGIKPSYETSFQDTLKYQLSMSTQVTTVENNKKIAVRLKFNKQIAEKFITNENSALIWSLFKEIKGYAFVTRYYATNGADTRTDTTRVVSIDTQLWGNIAKLLGTKEQAEITLHLATLDLPSYSNDDKTERVLIYILDSRNKLYTASRVVWTNMTGTTPVTTQVFSTSTVNPASISITDNGTTTKLGDAVDPADPATVSG